MTPDEIYAGVKSGDLRQPPLSRTTIVKLLAVWESAFPTLHPVVVRRPHSPDKEDPFNTWAWTDVRRIKGEKRLVITVPTTTPPPADFIILVHEYAHCMVWRPEHQEGTEDDHNDEWGCAHARLWRLITVG